MFDVKDIKSKIDQMVEKIKTDDTLRSSSRRIPSRQWKAFWG